MSLEGSLLQHAELRRAAGGVRGLWMTYGGNQWVHIGGEVVQLHEFGAVGDGITDDTAAVQAAINAAMGNTLYLPPGRYRITSTLTITGTNSIQIIGAGTYPGSNVGYGSGLYWEGNATDPLLHLLGVRDSLFENFGIVASSSFPVAVAIKSETSLAGGVATNNVYRRIWMEGVNGGIGKGWQFSAGDRGDANNDLNTFDEVVIANYSTAGVSFEHSQTKGHRFYNCEFYGWSGATGTAGIASDLGAANQGGSFYWFSGFMGLNAADFRLGAFNDALLITGLNSEGSQRLLTTAGAFSGAWPVTLLGCRWASGALHADQRIIDFRVRGPLTLIGNEFGSGGADPIVKIRFLLDGPGYATIQGNNFLNANSDLTHPVETTGSIAPLYLTMSGNSFAHAGGIPVVPTFTYPANVIDATFPHLAPDGTAGAPSYSFASLPTTGLKAGGGALEVVHNGTAQWRFAGGSLEPLTAANDIGLTTPLRLIFASASFRGAAGSVASPMFTFVPNADSGLYALNSGRELRVSRQGVDVAGVTAEGHWQVNTAVALLPIATPTTPAAGNGLLYMKSDKKLYFLNDAGTETALGYAIPAATPTTLSSDQNNYNPSGAGFWRLSSDATWTITGIADGSDGRQLVIINVGEKPIVLANQHASSTTTNRIITGTPANRELLPDEVATLIYDNTTTRWRIVH